MDKIEELREAINKAVFLVDEEPIALEAMAAAMAVATSYAVIAGLDEDFFLEGVRDAYRAIHERLRMETN